MPENHSKSAKERWEEMTDAERLTLRKEIGAGMRSYWATKSPEERRAIGLKAAETRRLNRIHKEQKLKRDNDYILEGDE